MKKIIVMAVLALFVMSLYSCKSTGYGCKGNSRTKTGFKEQKFIGY